MNQPTTHQAAFALARERAVSIAYPADMTEAEAECVLDWLSELAAKLVSPPADEPELPPVVEAKPLAPHANAKVRRLAIARLLADAPASSTVLCAKLNIPKGSIGGLLIHVWFTRERKHGAPYTLTPEGRRALRLEGYVVADDETKADEPKTVRLKPETIRPKPVQETPTDPAVRRRCKLIAEAITSRGVPLAAIEIAVECGLPHDEVNRRIRAHQVWFVRAEGVGDKYRLTAAGRELANEGVAA